MTMVDHVDASTRARIMRKVGSKGSGLERKISAALAARSIRHSLNVRGLPGTPDIVVASAQVAIFAHGCFWHGCPRHYRPPKAHAEFWRAKVNRNVERDAENERDLRALDWSVVVVWEHDSDDEIRSVVDRIVVEQLNRRSR